LGAKPIYVQVQEMRDMWRELWYGMAEGSKTEYDKIKVTDVFEFWKLFDLHKEKVKKERETYQKKQTHGKR
jgi:hypothetical protein